MRIKILLRDIANSDLPTLYEQQLDPEAAAMAAFPSRGEEAFMAHWAKIRADESNMLMTIVFDGRVAGNIVTWEQDGVREVGYWLGREFWGKGIVTQALKQLLEIEKHRPLVAHVARHNIASRRVLEKCGFEFVKEDKITEENGNIFKEFVMELRADEK